MATVSCTECPTGCPDPGRTPKCSECVRYPATEPVFTLTVMSDGDVIVDNALPAFPISDLVKLLRQVADGFESGEVRRIR